MVFGIKSDAHYSLLFLVYGSLHESNLLVASLVHLVFTQDKLVFPRPASLGEHFTCTK